MAIETINVGSSANSGTGDPLRTAFTKINNNFVELYAGAGGGAGSNLNGTGSPEGVVSAPVATFYVRMDSDMEDRLYIKMAGTGNTGWEVFDYGLGPDGSRQFEVGRNLDSVNHLRFEGSSSGGEGPSISAQGASTDINIHYAAKGLAEHRFGNGTGTLFVIDDRGALADQWLIVRPGESSTNPPSLESTTNLALNVASNTLRVEFRSGYNVVGKWGQTGTSTPTMWPELTGASDFVRIAAAGTTTNRSFMFNTGGNGSYNFWAGSGTLVLFDPNGQSTPANHFQFRAGTAGNAAVIRAAGETNGSLELQAVSGGSGTVRLSRAQFIDIVTYTSVTYTTPTTGFSFAFSSNVSEVHMTPAGTLASGTITMPNPAIDGQTVTITTTQAITALTLSPSAGQTITGAVTTLPANGFVTYRFRASTSQWRRVG